MYSIIMNMTNMTSMKNMANHDDDHGQNMIMIIDQVSGDKNITSSVLAFTPKYQDFGKNLTCRWGNIIECIRCKYIRNIEISNMQV